MTRFIPTGHLRNKMMLFLCIIAAGVFLGVLPGGSYFGSSKRVKTKDLYNLRSGIAKSYISPHGHDAKLPSIELLSNDIAPNVVHYLWCKVRIFEFQHYLSMKSVIRHIMPEKIVFHYANYPRHDMDLYNTWFEELKKEYPYIHLDFLGPNCTQCASEDNMLEFMKQILHREGGIYVQKNTVFADFPMALRKADMVLGINSNYEGFLSSKVGKILDNADAYRETIRLRCLTVDEFNKKVSMNGPICIIKTGTLFPRQTWDQEDNFSILSRLLFYGQVEVPKPKPDSTVLIPNIAHMFWVSNGQPMQFEFYLSCLSLLYLVKVEALYLHLTDQEPTGEYWDHLKTMKRFKIVKRTRPDMTFRNKIGFVQHMSDVFGVDLMLRYGGIYSDADALWTGPIPDDVRAYDAVLALDWPELHRSWPDYVNCGVMLGKPNSPYWKLFMEGFQDFKDALYGFNCLRRPYKIYERQPDLVYIYDRLQTICWNGKCHPTWWPNFRAPSSSHLDGDLAVEDVKAFHFVHPDPEEFVNKTTLLRSKTLYAKVGQRILKAAGIS